MTATAAAATAKTAKSALKKTHTQTLNATASQVSARWLDESAVCCCVCAMLVRLYVAMSIDVAAVGVVA